MQQLGASFINSFLLPYVQNQILGNIVNDTRLQNMFRYDKVLRPDELQGLEDYYFQDTGTLLATDAPLRKAFWKEFSGFVTRQKLLCEDSVLKFAFRVLPDEDTGAFSQEAQDNWGKFAYYAVNKLEDTLVQREIDQKQILGKISSAQAEDDKKDLKDGKMILVKGKNGKYDYMSDKTIARAIGNVERTAKMFAALETEKTEKGETKMYTFNPIESSDSGAEVSSSPQEVQELMWKKQSIGSEKDLENNGLFVEGHMTIDANGISRGFVKDRKGIRLRVEFDVKKPGERVYRMTFANNPDNKFFIADNELKNRFGEKKQGALEVFREKEREAGRVAGVVKSKGTRLRTGGGRITLPKDRKIRENFATGAATGAAAGAFEGRKYVPPVRPGETVSNQTSVNSSSQKEKVTRGALDAKKELESRLSNQKNKQPKQANLKGTGKKSPAQLKADKKKKSKSLALKVMKYYAAGAGGFIGTTGILSILS